MGAPLVITIIHGSIVDADVDVIVNAANSLGFMGGGVAGAIKRAAGQKVEDDARRQGSTPVGRAVLTSGGATKFKGIIHAPTMPAPGMRIPSANVRRATEAALSLADERGFGSMAFPGMGTGVGGVAPGDAAREMIRAIRIFSADRLRVVVLIDVDASMVDAWRECLEHDGQEKAT
jgi:O-acetyl-ADP-ribose deacetylase (regulator of RNase III)